MSVTIGGGIFKITVVAVDGRGKRQIHPGDYLTTRPDGKLDARKRGRPKRKMFAMEAVEAGTEKVISVSIVNS